MKRFITKKIIVSVIGLACALLAGYGINIPDELQKALIDAIMVIVGSYNIGQGIADGLSGGKTSSQEIKAQKNK